MSRGAFSAPATRIGRAARAAGAAANSSLRSSNSAAAFSGGLLARPCGSPRVLERRSRDIPPARSAIR